MDMPEFSDSTQSVEPRIQPVFCPEKKRGAIFRFRSGGGNCQGFELTWKAGLPAFILSSVQKRKEESSSDSEEEMEVELSVL